MANSFGPLSRPKPSASTSTWFSGPIYPPGFESIISNQIKKAHEKRRAKKLKKKRQKAQQLKKNQLNPSNQQPKKPLPFIPQISPEDIMTFANQIGMTFSGSSSELRERIEAALRKQQEDWYTNQS